MDDPMGCVAHIYDHFGMTLTTGARESMERYLESKPRDKFGAHQYTVEKDELSERRFFRNYQQAYDVPNEA